MLFFKKQDTSNYLSGVSGEGKIEETWAGMELGMSEVATRRVGWYKDTI